jgi:hypothetical protein
VAAAGVAEAASLEKTLSGTYDLPPGRQLVVRNVNGDVRLAVWDRDEVRVVAHKRARGGDEEAVAAYLDELRVKVDRGEDRLVFEVVHPRKQGGLLSWFSFGSLSGDVDFEITAPRQAAVELSTVNGGVHVEQLAGSLGATSVNGRIDMASVGGEVDASTVNGGIQLAFDDVAPSGTLELTTVNGSITMEAPQDLRAVIDARTTNGSVSSDLPVVEEGHRSRTRLVGSLNGGGATIRLRTTNGSVRLRGV